MCNFWQLIMFLYFDHILLNILKDTLLSNPTNLQGSFSEEVELTI